MKKLLFIQPKLTGVGGIEKVVPDIAEGLSREGYEVESLTFFGFAAQSFWNKQSDRGEVMSISRLLRISGRFLWLVRQVRERKPDVIIVSAYGTTMLVLLAKALLLIKGTPVIVFEHQSLMVSGPAYRIGLRLLQPFVTGCVAVSKGVETELLAIVSAPVATIYNPVRLCSGVSNHPIVPTFVTASRLETIKGVDILIALFCRYFSEGNPGSLIVYGEGSLVPELSGMIQQYGLENRIILAGSTSDVCAALADKTVYVSAARSEAFGVSLVEALSLGMPILASDVPYGPREICMIPPDTTLSYPAANTYGVLYSDIVADEAVLYDRFKSGMAVVLSTRYDSSALKERADSFSIDVAVSGWRAFLATLEI